MTTIIYDITGVAGVSIVLFAYYLLERGIITAQKHISYSVMNIAGSGMVIISLSHSWNLPAFVMNIFWILISLIGIGRILWQRKRA